MESKRSLDWIILSGMLFYIIFIYPLARNLILFRNSIESSLTVETILIAVLTGSIGAIVILQITNYLSSTYLIGSNSQKSNIFLKMNIFLSSISMFTGIFQTFLGRGEPNPDHFGVDIAWEFWVEWMVTIPMLVLSIFLYNNTALLSWSEVIAVTCHVCLVAFGYALHFDLPSFPGVFPFLFIGGVVYCFGVTFVVLVRSYAHSQSFFITSDSSERSSARHQVHSLSCLLFAVVCAIIGVYVCRALGVLDRDRTSVCCLLINSLSRMIFSECTSNPRSLGSGYVSDPMTKLEERKKVDAERIAYLKYVFHEARVPLQSFTLGLELFSDPNATMEKKKEMLEIMKEANAYISHTFDDVLSIQQIESKSIELKVQPFNLKRLIRSLVTTLSSPIHFKQLNLILDISSHLPSLLLGDGSRLIHVIANFLSNSIKFSPPNSDIRLQVTSKFTSDLNSVPAFIHQYYPPSRMKTETNRSNPVSPSTETACEVCVEVIDQGIGISESDQAKLFTPYMQVDPEKNQGGHGTGIGLVLCQQIIMMHGGRLICRSKAGEGSTFGFTLTLPVVNYDRSEEYDKESDDSSNGTTEPLRSTDSDPPRSSDSDQSSLPLASTQVVPRYFSPIDPVAPLHPDSRNILKLRSAGPSLNVLVVEDSVTNKRLLQRLLSLKGIISDGIDDCTKVVNLLSQDLYRYDVILMDRMMHGMSGSDTTLKLRSLGFNNIIVGLTGCAFDDERMSFLRAGADCVLTKPINMKLFENLLLYFQQNGVRSHHQVKETICLEDMKNIKWIQISSID